MFKAFADERRLRILHLLRDGEMCVADLVEVLGLPQSTVSRQPGILREAGLVCGREDGLWRHYALTAPDSPLHEHLVDCLGSCFEHVPEFKADAKRARRIQKSGGCCPETGSR
jgi:ArsR family transcriptional regulator